MLLTICIIIFAFLSGSIPTGYFIVKITKGIDIRTVGSGNIGSTNVKRIAGTKFSIITQIFDILKGTIPVGLTLLIGYYFDFLIENETFIPIVGLIAILGHDFSPFLNFRGGKGVNTTIGVFLIIATFPTLIGIAVYFMLRFLTGIVSVSSLGLGITLPITAIFFHMSSQIIISSMLSAILILVLHKDNIGRLLRSEEKPIGEVE